MESNFLDPVFWFFCLGFVAGCFKSDLHVPPVIRDTIGIYLLLSIGLKGGKELHGSPLADLLLPICLTLALGVVIPVIAYSALRKLGRFGPVDSAAVAAHYGSTSVVTFAVAQAYLVRIAVPYENYAVVLLVVLEVPAIIVGILLAKTGMNDGKVRWADTLQEVFLGKSVLLLVGGLAVGLVNGPEALEPTAPFFEAPFKGILSLYMIGMGVSASERLGELRKTGPFLVVFAIVMPMVSGLLATLGASAIGMGLGGTVLLATLAASASYIAAPAAVQIALPKANPTYYLVASLGITFPFNITLGIPLYYWMATVIL